MASERDRLVESVRERGLTVEILCNNAGYGTAGRFVKLDRDREVSMVRLNCEAVVDLCGRYARRWSAAAAAQSSTSPRRRPSSHSQASPHTPRVRRWSCHSPKPSTRSWCARESRSLCCARARSTEFATVAGIDGIDESTPDFVWTTPDKVAEAAVRGLQRNDRVVIPGAINSIGAVAGRLTPRQLWLALADRFYPVGRE